VDPKYNGCQPTTGSVAYSPGMCPENMVAVTASLNGSVYTERCCQKGFSLPVTDCHSYIATTTNVLLAPRITTTDSYTVFSNIGAIHPPFDVLWKSADLTAFPSDEAARRQAVIASLASSHATNTTSITTGATSLTTHTTSTTAAATQAPSDRTDMSTDVKIGIGVGVTVASLIISLFIAAWLVNIMRRRRLAPRGGAQELDADYTAIWKRFMGSDWRAEMANDQVPAELDGSNGESQRTEISDQERTRTMEESDPCFVIHPPTY
jgi:hypothetical protein